MGSSDAAMASITSNLNLFCFYCLILLISFHSMLAAPLETYQEVSVKDSIPPYNLQFSPEKNPEVPIKRGEKRCDNIYHGEILPCLLRPHLPSLVIQLNDTTIWNTRRRNEYF